VTTDGSTARSIAADDEAAIRAAVDDYYLGWFDADAARVARSLHPELAKRGWLRERDGDAFLDDDSFDTMTRLAAAGHGRRGDPAERAYRVSVVDIDVDIAAVSVHTLRAVDYLHLVRTGAGWRIVHALWRGMADDARWRW